ncbi:putative glycerate kinase [Arthrobacter globiformis NBRC 12137]|uniref:Putative glycerate kinase n=1 Tax=Arthrobacter globiformis (strain ATCC 8010 / DSM 20124 / JCM 1332 / NBRC 12137 / NCIMB 8907 / NRRL B-2979 / 168) TaxID=1077972 RepID=H0QMY4_ARTG1|nr:glycerate kinase [Arthrobacter globiformis]GAB14185.1 putative glycerate kinase [Arthrobacter globiformis NBRC 12137]
MTSPTAPKTVRTLIAPDKFKGSLTAGEVAEALAAGLRSVSDASGKAGAVRCELLPLADGGDGSVDAAVTSGFTRRCYTVAGPTGQPVQASIAFDGTTAVVEVANTCGLALLPNGKLEPLNASSRGFGEAVLFALSLNPARVVMALGGSASTDGGMGMLTALGYRFLDAEGRQLSGSGKSLAQIHAVERTGLPELDETDFIVASDVHNPLLGRQGAPAVFGPQKGAGTEEITALNDGLAHYVSKLAEAGDLRAEALANHEGAGSAGGLGFACLLLGATQVSGADYFLDLLDFNTRKDSCDVVITGEGSIDEQTLAGKLPAAVARRSGGRPIIAVAGRSLLPRERWAEMALSRVYTLADYTDRDSARDPALSAALLRRIGQDIAAGLL